MIKYKDGIRYWCKYEDVVTVHEKIIRELGKYNMKHDIPELNYLDLLIIINEAFGVEKDEV